MTVSSPLDAPDAAPRRNKRWWRIPLWILLGVVVLEVLINVALNVGVVQAIMRRGTDRTQLSWQRAWWLWPVGRLHLKGFTLTNQDTERWWKVEVDALTAGMSLTGLLRKRVDVHGIDGHGATFHLEPSPAPEEEPSDPNARPWVINLEDVTLHGVRELDFSRVRFVGALDVNGALNLQSRERLQVDLPSVRVAEGFMEVDGKRVARLEALSASARLDAPFQGEQGYDLSQAIGGQAQVKVDLLPLDWVNDLLGPSAPVSLRGGSGRLDLDVRMQRNTLEPGSRLEARGAELDLRAGPMRARAPWSLKASMDEERPGQPAGQLHIAFAPVKVSGPKGNGVEVPEVALTVLARRREGQPGFDLEPELNVAKSRPLDLRLLNPWLEQTLEIDSGHVTVRSEERSKRAKARKALELRMDTDLVSGSMGKHKVLLRAEVEVDARHLSWDMKELGLAGTTLRLSNVSSNGPVPIRAWSGTFSLPRASLTLSPTVLSARFSSQLTDTQPLVALITSSKRLPAFLTSLLNIPKVEVTGQVQIDERGLQVRELKAKGDSFSLEGHLDLVQGNITGALLTTLGPVTGGIELRPGDNGLHLVNAKQWFAGQQAPPFR
ncbi:hypothetical protein D7Y13_31900 [Corallococcus praedator]|uniref:Translocation/assembly module TamB n=1 Tax=Corallococcus praedator TaxID=2316724 RepID=A0ABX9QAZ9_9BACT|nr:MULTISPECIES: hypothetical protein [Corallococcus]RKH22382.1 hypothetical protein D7X75_35585 [Corallococcus sp. CA031C]RKH95535.1 hypothetical protein D7Y13_31900 [Corallococcus praedator]